MFRERSLEPNYPDKIEVDIEDFYRDRDKLEEYEKALYYIKEAIKGWDTETPEEWANILGEIQWVFEHYEVDV